jgi:predicted secreted protein
MHKVARLAGLFYLIFILTTALATYMRSQLIVFGDAAATAQNIAANEILLRTAFVTELISAMFFLLAAWALYSLLRPVNRDLALLFLLLNLGGVVVECVNMLNLFAALPLLSGADYLTVFPADQLQAQALMYIDLYANGFMIAQIFYGSWLLPLGYLVYRSGFLPRWLGLLLIADFVGVLGWFLQHFLLPGFDALSYPFYLLGFIAEVSLTMWLLLKGVKEPTTAGVGL